MLTAGAVAADDGLWPVAWQRASWPLHVLVATMTGTRVVARSPAPSRLVSRHERSGLSLVQFYVADLAWLLTAPGDLLRLGHRGKDVVLKSLGG